MCFFPSISVHFAFISFHFASVSFHFPFISFQIPFISFHVACISCHFASVSFLSLTPDMAIENGNRYRVFYVQFLQPISLKESRKVPSVFALFMNIAIKRCIGSSAGNYACEKSVCAMLCVLYSMCIPSNHFLVNISFV